MKKKGKQGKKSKKNQLHLQLFSMHGLIRGKTWNWAAMQTPEGKSNTWWNWPGHWANCHR
jgi:hypothetical protein